MRKLATLREISVLRLSTQIFCLQKKTNFVHPFMLQICIPIPAPTHPPSMKFQRQCHLAFFDGGQVFLAKTLVRYGWDNLNCVSYNQSFHSSVLGWVFLIQALTLNGRKTCPMMKRSHRWQGGTRPNLYARGECIRRNCGAILSEPRILWLQLWGVSK